MDPDHRNSASAGLLDDLYRAALAARALAIPYRNQDVGQCKEPLAHGVIALLRGPAPMRALPRLLHVLRGTQEGAELADRKGCGEVLLEARAVKGEDRAQPPASAERGKRRESVGAFG
jgi:hypothetical protein